MAELAARIILDARPELVDQADWDFLTTEGFETGGRYCSNC